MKNISIEITTGTIVKALAVILAFWFIYLIRDILVLLFISVIIVSAIDPVVDWLQVKKIPRVAGVLMIYLILFVILSLVLSFLIPPLAGQIADFAKNYPVYYQKIQEALNPLNDFFSNQHMNVNTQNVLDNVSNWLNGASSHLFSTTVGFFSGLISVVSVLAMAFYMAVVEDSLKKFVALVAPGRHEEYAISLTMRMKRKIGKWMEGQMMLMAVIFILDFVGLTIIGIPYALPLAVLAGLLEVVPYVGPIVSAVPGIILGFLISPVKGLLTLALYVIVQESENNIFVPLIMKRAVDLNPVAVILALLTGAKLGGVLGAIIAVPLATAASIIVKDIVEAKNKPVVREA
jgi:predicted PurR-regulated permease PerM